MAKFENKQKSTMAKISTEGIGTDMFKILVSALQYEDEERSKRKREKNRMWPSESSIRLDDLPHPIVIGECGRALYYKLTGAKITDPVSSRSLISMWIGKSLEQAIIQSILSFEPIIGREIFPKCTLKDEETGKEQEFRATNYKYQYSVPAPSGRIITISGEIDGMINETENRSPYIIEIKTEYGRGAKKDNDKDKEYRPRLSYLMQVYHYLYYFTNKLDPNFRDKDITSADINILDRGNGFSSVHKIEFNKGILHVNGKPINFITLKGMLNKWDEVLEYVENKTVPPRDYSKKWTPKHMESLCEIGELSNEEYKSLCRTGKEKGDWQCNGYCQYRSLCYAIPEKDEYLFF